MQEESIESRKPTPKNVQEAEELQNQGVNTHRTREEIHQLEKQWKKKEKK